MSVEDEGFTADELARLKDADEGTQGLLKEIELLGGDDDSGAARSVEKPAAEAAAAVGENSPPDKRAVDAAKAAGQRDAALAVDDDDDDAPADPKSATVPYQRFQHERKKAREKLAALEKQIGEVNEKFARGDERLRLLSEVMTQPAAEETADEDREPNPNEDIIAWAQWSRREMGRLREATAGTSQTIAEQSMLGNYQRDAVSFVRANPDFPAAYNHLLSVRGAMLQEQGHNEVEIRQILHNEERGLVQRAFQARKRPAALIYGMARQMGFRPPPPAATARVSNARGASQEVTVEALAEMSDSQFADFYSKKKGQIDTLLGRRTH